MPSWPSFFLPRPQGPNLVSPSGYEGGFEDDRDAPRFVDDSYANAVPGTMTLKEPTTLPPGWQAVHQVQWLSDWNKRWAGDAPLGPAEGGKFLDLSSTGANQDGGVVARIPLKRLRSYEVSLSLGTNEDRPYSCGPVEVVVQAIDPQTSAVLGQLRFRKERGAPGEGLQWQKLTGTLSVGIGEPAYRPHEEAFKGPWTGGDVDTGAPDTPEGTLWFLIQMIDLTQERIPIGDANLFVGLDAVSVRELAPSLLELLYGAANRMRLRIGSP